MTTEEEEREDKIDDALLRIIDEGIPRLKRGWIDLLATATMAGIEVGFGVVAYLVVEEATGSQLLAGLAFSIGFIALLLGHSELFTEGFLVPVTVLVAGKATWRDLARFWTGTLVGNLIGGLVVGWLISHAYPRLHETANVAASNYIQAGLSVRTLCLAFLAGGAITLLTRMHQGTDEDVPKVLASIGIAFLLAGGGLFHSVLDSVLAFTALASGSAPFSYLDWLGWVWWVLLANIAGGLLLTTLLRLVRSRQRLLEIREEGEGVTG